MVACFVQLASYSAPRQVVFDGGSPTPRFTEDVRKFVWLECGIVSGFLEYEVGDIIECYSLEKVAQTLDLLHSYEALASREKTTMNLGFFESVNCLNANSVSSWAGI